MPIQYSVRNTIIISYSTTALQSSLTTASWGFLLSIHILRNIESWICWLSSFLHFQIPRKHKVAGHVTIYECRDTGDLICKTLQVLQLATYEALIMCTRISFVLKFYVYKAYKSLTIISLFTRTTI